MKQNDVLNLHRNSGCNITNTKKLYNRLQKSIWMRYTQIKRRFFKQNHSAQDRNTHYYETRRGNVSGNQRYE